MKLKNLLEGIEVKKVSGPLDIDIKGIAYDSNRVEPGCLFVAIPGSIMDGHSFIEDAVRKGAVAVIGEKEVEVGGSVTSITVKNSRHALALVSSKFLGHPSKDINVTAITGTNGKTTITYLLESILKAAGRKPGILGTINYRFGGKVIPANVTTPQSLDLQTTLAEMRAKGVSHAIIEASSHGIHQERVSSIDFDCCVFTNLAQDHLDYHETMEEYAEAKSLLFHSLLPQSSKEKRTAVINFDDPVGVKISETLKNHKASINVITYACDNQKDSQIHPIEYHLSLDGIEIKIRTPLKRLNITSPLIGRHNMYNILAAVGGAIAIGMPIGVIKEGVEDVSRIPGRLERIENDLDLTIFVDYAHTPDALDKILDGIKPFSIGRVVTVFGCGGDRDQTKRPLMAQAAWNNSDLVIVTSDNPRTEDPGKIIKDIEKGFPPDSHYKVIADRKEAIKEAVGEIMPGDLLVVAGKGHEDYQIIGCERLHFDDREVIEEALNDRM